jgi:hypothetical protein
MIYFLFFDGALGQYFVIEGDEDWVMEDAWIDASAVVDDEDELEYVGIVSGEEVERKRYDVY